MYDLPLWTGKNSLRICSQGDFYPRDGNSIHPVVILQQRELERTCRPFSHNPVFRGLVLAVTPKHIQHVHPMALSDGCPRPIRLLQVVPFLPDPSLGP